MYLVIRKINDNQIPLRACENIDNAYEYQKRYIEDSSKNWRSYETRSSKEKLRKGDSQMKIYYLEFKK